VDFKRINERILDLDKDGMIWGLLSNDIVLRTSVAWQSFTAKIMDATYIDNEGVKHFYSLQRFLAMTTLNKLNIVDSGFGG